MDKIRLLHYVKEETWNKSEKGRLDSKTQESRIGDYLEGRMLKTKDSTEGLYSTRKWIEIHVQKSNLLMPHTTWRVNILESGIVGKS